MPLKKIFNEKFLEFAITLEVSKLINSPLNQPNTLEVLFNALNGRVNADICALNFFQKDTNELFIISRLSPAKKQLDEILFKIKNFSKKLSKNETSVKNIQITGRGKANNLKCLEHIPLTSDKDTLCVLSVGSFKQELKKKDIKFINILAKEFSLFLENDKDKRELADERNIIASIIGNMTEGVMFIDNSRKVAIINNAAKIMLEIRNNPEGKKINLCVKNKEILDIIDAVGTKAGNLIYKEIAVEKHGGLKKKIIRCYGSKTSDKEKNPLGITLVLTDITYEKEANEARIDFLSTASHELRTPLSAIKQSIELLKSDDALNYNGEQMQLLKIAHKNINRLSALINDVLDITKIESGKMRFHFEKTNILTVIDDCVSTFNLVAREKYININTKLDKKVPEVYIDKHRIIQVLGNLLSNAVKFTPCGGNITVEVGIYPLNKNYIIISVKDTGAGIDKKDIPNLFKKFQQLSTSPEKNIKGTGLGLAIAKDIVHLHNGYIWIESEKGSGCKFSFILPVERRKNDKENNGIGIANTINKLLGRKGYLNEKSFDN